MEERGEAVGQKPKAWRRKRLRRRLVEKGL